MICCSYLMKNGLYTIFNCIVVIQKRTAKFSVILSDIKWIILRKKNK